MHIRRISVANYPYQFKQGNYYPYPIRIRENCGYPQDIYPRIHIRASLADGKQLSRIQCGPMRENSIKRRSRLDIRKHVFFQTELWINGMY